MNDISFNTCAGILFFVLAGSALIGIGLIWAISTFGLPALLVFLFLIMVIGLVLIIKG